MRHSWGCALFSVLFGLAAAGAYAQDEEEAPLAEPAQAAKPQKQAAQPAAEKPKETKPAPAEAKPEEVPAPAKASKSEPKPAPAEEAPAEAPKPAPQAQPPKPPPTAKPMTPEERAKRELKFLQETFGNATEDILPSLAATVDTFLWQFRESAGADQAQFLKSEIHERKGESWASFVDLVKLLHEYPQTEQEFNAKKRIFEILDKRARKQKPAVEKVIKDIPADLDRPGRQAAFLKAMVVLKEPGIYEPMRLEFVEFLRRYPGHPSEGEITLLLAQLHAQNGVHSNAILINKGILATSNDDALKSRAQMSIGDTLASALKDYDGAVEAYRVVTAKYAAYPAAGEAYVKMAKILDENLKQPGLALETLDKIVQNYPKSDAALQAFLEQSRIEKDRNKDYGKAIKALQGLADMFPGDRCVQPLKDAAALAGDYLKDQAMQALLLERAASEAPGHKDAPQALWDAAQLYEKDLANLQAAKLDYARIVKNYSSHPLSKKARKQLDKLSKQ
jgi:tetratricopeptide (TPR) repeat protein